MKSKTSFFNDTLGNWTPPAAKASFPGDFFNRTLYLKNLTRWWPLWGMASLGGALFPLAVILAFLRNNETLTALEFASGMYEVVAYAVPIVMLCYCILCAMAVWGYLYNARGVGLMHTLPIRREGLFVTNFLSGLTMVAIPCVVTGLFTILLSIVGHGFSAKAFLVTIAAVAGEGFFYFSAATATAFITGNAFALPVLYFIFQFLYPLLDLLVSMFSSNLVFGLRQNSYTGLLDWLCPTVYLMNNIDVRRLYDIPFPDDGLMRNYIDHWNGVALENGWLIGAYALTGVFWLAVAWLLYRRRRSESAGDVISVGWLKPVFQACVTAVCALGGGQFLYLLLMNGFDIDYAGYALLPLILCMTFAGAIGYYAAAMLLAKTLRVFNKKSLTGVGVTLACCTVLCSLIAFDVFGVAGRVPTGEEVTYVHLYVAENNYYLYPGEDDALIEQVRELQKAIISDRKYIQTAKPYQAWDSENTDWTYQMFNLDYRLKSGLEVRRSYPLYLSRERMAAAGTYDNLLDALVNGAAMRQKRLHAGDPRFRPSHGSLYVERGDRSYDLSSRELSTLLEALGKDAASGAWGECLWFDKNTKMYAMHLNMEFEAVGGNGVTARDWDYTGINIQAGMDNTIAALKDLGYITDADLLTNDELAMYREKYGYNWDWESNTDVPDDGTLETAVTEDGQFVLVDPVPAEEAAEGTAVPEPAEAVPGSAESVPDTVEPVPVTPNMENGAANPDENAMDPNSYTPPASSGSLDGMGG